jgi:type VI secretion system secreted protein Hcp
MRVNKASPKLFLAMAKGERFTKATLAVNKPGAQTQGDYLTLTFTDVLITSYQSAETEKLSLSFSKVEFEYKATKADGSLEAPVKACWDSKTNKAC